MLLSRQTSKPRKQGIPAMAPKKLNRTRVREIKDNIHLFSFRTRKTIKIPRRVSCGNNGNGIQSPGQSSSLLTDGEGEACLRVVDIEQEGQQTEKSGYFVRKEKLLEKWDEIRDQLVATKIEANGMPENQRCIVCSDNVSEIRCNDCGTEQFFCACCAEELHQGRNLFHSMEYWKGRQFVPFLHVPKLNLPKNKKHLQCCYENWRRISVLTRTGDEKECDVCFCDCTSDANILLAHGLWPASPTTPVLAVEIPLMDFLESLFLESQVSLSSFCNALKWKNILSQKPILVKHLYNSLSSNDTFDQYRYYKYRLRNLRTLCPDISDGTVCPACPKEFGSVFWNMDACFGLFRKRSAGKEPLPSLHGPLYFEEQDDVDNFLATYQTSGNDKGNDLEKECSQFQAGGGTSLMHSKRKNQLFDEKALFGCVCRHEFPTRFLNIKHGERFGYAVYLLEQLLDSTANANFKKNVVYDIGCKLERHVEITKNAKIQGKVSFMVPEFHAFAHSTNCQVKSSIFYAEGSGLSNGEQCERLWSYLRCFSSITREMTASHRLDCLTDALLYHSDKAVIKMGTLTVDRLTRARNACITSESELNKLLLSLSVGINDAIIWAQELTELVSRNYRDTRSILLSDWKCKYVTLLLVHKQLSLDIVRSANEENDGVVSSLVKRKTRIEEQLKVIEKANKIDHRWKITDPRVKQSIAIVEKQQRCEVIMKLRSLAFDRWFLLSLKQKYSTGQKIAKVLSRNIDGKVTNIRKIISSYNGRVAFKLKLIDFEQIRYINAVDLQDVLYKDLPSLEENVVPSEMKRKVIELYTANKRAQEEVLLCQQDMHNIMEFLQKERGKVLSAIQLYSYRPTSNFNNGAVCLLTKKSSMMTELLVHCRNSFNAVGVREEINSTVASLHEEDSSTTGMALNLAHVDEFSDDEDAFSDTNELSNCNSDDNQSDADFFLYLEEDSD